MNTRFENKQDGYSFLVTSCFFFNSRKDFNSNIVQMTRGAVCDRKLHEEQTRKKQLKIFYKDIWIEVIDKFLCWEKLWSRIFFLGSVNNFRKAIKSQSIECLKGRSLLADRIQITFYLIKGENDFSFFRKIRNENLSQREIVENLNCQRVILNFIVSQNQSPTLAPTWEIYNFTGWFSSSNFIWFMEISSLLIFSLEI